MSLEYQDIDYTDAAIAGAVHAAHIQTDEHKDRIIAVMDRNITHMVVVLVLGKHKHVCWMYNHSAGGLHWGAYDNTALPKFMERTTGVPA